MILVLCTGNSCRSQMAEFLWRELDPSAEVASAGTEPTGFVHPLALRVLAELGIDASTATSKPVSRFLDADVDLVVTVCDGAREHCPTFPRARASEHWPFEDPAKAQGGEDERLAVFRRVRDEIAARIRARLA